MVRKAKFERDRALNETKILNVQHQERELARLLDYVKQQMAISDTDRVVQTWKRKMEILERKEQQLRSQQRDQ
jgi:uncharacterized protein YeeX (DUF496 family)